MVQILTLRERLAAVPGTVRRRAEGAGERLAAVAAARAIAPEIPRTADAGHLERAAHRLLRRAAQDEFAREGVARLPLPEGTDREALRRADVPGDAAFHAFVEDLLGAIDIAPSTLERDDALALRDGRGARDAYGLSPEVAGDLASYLLCLAHGLRREETGGGTRGRGTGAAADDGTLEEYLAGQEASLREEVRATLVRLVRVPLELQDARERHARHGKDSATLTSRTRTAFETAQAEAGRAAFGALRNGAERVYERYGTGRTPPRP